MAPIACVIRLVKLVACKLDLLLKHLILVDGLHQKSVENSELWERCRSHGDGGRRGLKLLRSSRNLHLNNTAGIGGFGGPGLRSSCLSSVSVTVGSMTGFCFGGTGRPILRSTMPLLLADAGTVLLLYHSLVADNHLPFLATL